MSFWMEFEKEYRMNENKDQKKNYYDVLGVPKDATEDMIKKAYKKLAVKWHPDKHKTAAKKVDAEVKFKELGEAYTTLSDPGKRRMYDLTEGDFDDIPEFDFDFEDVESGKMPFFTKRGGGSGGGRSAAPPPPVFQQPDYNELFNNFLREQEKNFFEKNPGFNPANLGDNHPFGKENPFANSFFTQNMPKFSFGQFNFPAPPNPFGSPSGTFTSSSTSTSSSSSSTGEGSGHPNPPSPPSPKQKDMEATFSSSDGRAKKVDEKSQEKSQEKSHEKSQEKDLQIEFDVEFQLKDLLCGAKRKLTYKANLQPSPGKGERIFIAEISPGMKYGESVSYPGQGHYCPKTRKTGDLIIKIIEPKVSKYPEYSREGNDLIHVKEVQLCDVLCGSPIFITHLDESEFSYTETEMIRDAGTRRLKGRGFQVSSSESKKGDMVVKYKIIYPPKIYTGQKADLLKSILPHEVYDSDSESENDS